jgi:hypothetical protein
MTTSDQHAFNVWVDVVNTDYGRQVILPNIYMQVAAGSASASSGFLDVTGISSTTTAQYHSGYCILDTSKIAIGVFRPFKPVDLPPNGDSKRGYVVGEYSVIVKHPSAVGYVNRVSA